MHDLKRLLADRASYPCNKLPNLISGLICAISNTVANTAGFLAPLVISRLLDADNSLEQWQWAFWISAAIYIPGVILFLIFGTDQLRPWAK